DPKSRPFDGFPKWEECHRYNSNLVSFLPWLAYVVVQTINACNDLTTAFAHQIKFPPELAPGYRVFVRGENGDVAGELLKINDGKLIWWEDEPPSQVST